MFIFVDIMRKRQRSFFLAQIFIFVLKLFFFKNLYILSTSFIIFFYNLFKKKMFFSTLEFQVLKMILSFLAHLKFHFSKLNKNQLPQFFFYSKNNSLLFGHKMNLSWNSRFKLEHFFSRHNLFCHFESLHHWF